MAKEKSKTKSKKAQSSSANQMRKITIEKVVLNIGASGDTKEVDKAVSLLKMLTGKKVVKTHAKKRIATWNIRPGLPVGAKVTLRGKNARKQLLRLLKAINNKLKSKSFVSNGFSFGVDEYIDILDIKYDPKIGIIGLNVSVTLQRNGYRIKRRRSLKRKIPKKHTITKKHAIKFAENELGVTVE